MAKFQITKGSTSVILTVFIQDSSATTGAGLAGLDQTSSIVGGYVKRNGLGVALVVDENVTTEGTYEAPTTAGQVRIGTPVNQRSGVYELHFHNDLFTTADWVTITLGGATNMADLPLEVQLTTIDLNDGVRGGMTALPDAAAEAAGGLFTRGTGAGQINQDANGRADANVANMDSSVITSGAFSLGAVNAAAIATDAIGSSELATSAVQEIRDAITGGAFALDTDANGRIRIVDGTGVGEIDTDGGAVVLSATGLDAIASTSIGMVEQAKATWDRDISKANHNLPKSAGKTLRQSAALIVNEGTLQSATADTAVIAASASAVDDIFRNNLLIITDGLGVGQSRVIPDYTGSTRTCTITPPWVITPDATSDYEILPAAVHTATQNGEYDNGMVFVNTVTGRAGILIGVNGTTTDPSDNIADARTIADILNLKKFFIAPDSDVTLGQSFDGYLFEGAGGTVRLGGQSISGSIFRFVKVSGIGTGSNDTLFSDVRFIGPTQLENPTFFNCDLFSNITFTGANFIGIHNCFNSSGTTTILDFGAAIGNVQVNMVVNGDFEIHNMGQTGTDTLDYNGIGILVFNVNNIGGTATIIGTPEITDSSAGLTINNLTSAKKLDDIQGPTFNPATDSLEDIFNQLTVGGVLLQSGTAAGQLNFTSGVVDANLAQIEAQTLIDGETIIGTYRIFGAVLAGKSSSNGTTFRSMDDLKTRVTGTVDGSSNRTAVTLDGS